MKATILHAYSAENLGDGLLVDSTVAILQEALPDVSITLVASRPDAFTLRDVRVLCSQPTLRGYRKDYLRALRELGDQDLVVGVGGGYQRAGGPVEALKFGLVHGPQLFAASRRGVRSVYLPQSVGPLRLGTRTLVRARLGRLERVFLRDDRSIAELALGNAERVPDLAISVGEFRRHGDLLISELPVLSVRPVHGSVPAPVLRLADLIRPFDGYIQSRVGGNDDTAAVDSLSPERVLDADEFLGGSTRRVVVAVRLHAALMALQAGHYVVHLAYERKGFGAFQDLGLPEFVHPVGRFDPEVVQGQVRALSSDPYARADYDRRLERALSEVPVVRAHMVSLIRSVAGVGQ